MTIDIEPLRSLDDLAACERLERRLFGDHPGAVVGVSTLRTIAEAGGLLLGVRADRVTHELAAAAVSVSGEYERFTALFDLFLVVAVDARGQGMGLALRQAQRRFAQDAGVEVVRSWIDPLDSHEAHILWNRLGAIGTAYERSALGEPTNRLQRGLATDRVLAEWWLRSPRTVAMMDGGSAAAHRNIGLHEMTVATRTTPGPAGQRVLAGVQVVAGAANVLVEIPGDIRRLGEADADEARKWRLGTREAFERLLAAGYLFAGLVREGGRSFQLMVREDRSDALRRS